MTKEIAEIPEVIKFMKSGMRVDKKHSFALRKKDIALIVLRSILSWGLFLFCIYKLIF